MSDSSSRRYSIGAFMREVNSPILASGVAALDIVRGDRVRHSPSARRDRPFIQCGAIERPNRAIDRAILATSSAVTENTSVLLPTHLMPSRLLDAFRLI